MLQFSNCLKINALKIHCPAKPDPALPEKLAIENWLLHSVCCACGVLEALVNVSDNYNRSKVIVLP